MTRGRYPSSGIVLLSALLAAAGCGGATGAFPSGEGGMGGLDGQGEPGGPTPDGPSGGSGGTGGTGGSTQQGTGGQTPVAPECPEGDAPPPVTPECDPMSPLQDCGPGEGCYPYLIYPFGQGCGFPTFGAICAPASQGQQGEFCGDGLGYCEPGFMCVVGAAGGKRCAKLCSLVAPSGCEAGLICGETDVEGFGVCF